MDIPEIPKQLWKDLKRIPTGPPAPAELKDRVTFSVQFIHEHYPDKPFETAIRGSILSKVKETPIKRRIDLKPGASIPLDLVWLKSFECIVIIQNVTGKDRTTIPNQEEQDEIDRSIAFIHFGPKGVGVPISPNLPTVFTPPQDVETFLSVKNGPVSLIIWVIPQ